MLGDMRTPCNAARVDLGLLRRRKTRRGDDGGNLALQRKSSASPGAFRRRKINDDIDAMATGIVAVTGTPRERPGQIAMSRPCRIGPAHRGSAELERLSSCAN